MTEKFGLIKNPLTIIAIFAGIAEVSGTVVLPFISDNNEIIFIYFLMSFPTLLVLLFFLTLNFNNKALYAPSDFKNEENYVKIFKYDFSRQQKVEVQVPPSELLKLTNDNIIQLQKLSEDRFLKIETFISKMDKPKEIGQTIESEEPDLIISDLQISVSNFPNAKSFIQKLNNIGYDAEIYEAFRGVSTFSEHKAIWLGYRVGFNAAKEIILKAKESFPQIEYIELSNDFESSPPEYVHSQIYIGGSTTAAEEKGLKPFRSIDWEDLKNTNDIESLHNLISNHNSYA